MKERKLWLKMEIARLGVEWDNILQPSPSGFTVDNYHRWPMSKLSYVVSIQDKQSAYRRELWGIRLRQLFVYLTQ